MSAAEIEKAILNLPREELEEFAEWWTRFRTEVSDSEREKRLEVIASTSGCLAGEDGDDFAALAAEAGSGIEDGHGW